MKTGWKIAILGALIISSQVALRVCANVGTPSFPKSTLTIDTADGKQHKFAVQVATTPEQTEYGLMFRRQLNDDTGMLFIWDRPWVIKMWMKNTYIPLDMLFLDATGKITHITADAKPESLDIISSEVPSSAVIEVSGGTASRLGILVGDKVESKDLAETKQEP